MTPRIGTDQGSDDDGDELQELSGKRRIKRWTSQEHELLVRLVEQLGEDACWATIAEHIPGRSGKQCRERWVNHIGADIKKGGWTTEEEAQVARLHATIGPAWTRIANALGGRTENSVKNHFNALLRSKRLEDKKTSVLAQYVRLVRDKQASGMQAYEQACLAYEQASSSQNTNSQGSKGRARTAQVMSSASDGRMPGASAGGSVPMSFGAPPGMTPIRTSYMGSPGNPSYNSGGGAGVPGSGTPMSAPDDASAAIAAAAAAVQAANNAMGLSGTDSMQYSGGSPGVLGSLQSLSDSDQLAIRGMRRTGRGGRGRPGYGHMPTLRDARSSGTPSTRDAAQAALAADSLHMQWGSTHDLTAGAAPTNTPLSGSGAPFTPMSGSSHPRMGSSTGPQGGWMGSSGTPASMLHAAQHGFDPSLGHMVQSSPSSARDYTGPSGTSALPSAMHDSHMNDMLGQAGVDRAGQLPITALRPGAHDKTVHTLGGGVLSGGGAGGAAWGQNGYNAPADSKHSPAHLLGMSGGSSHSLAGRAPHPRHPSAHIAGGAPPAPHDMALAGKAGTSANSMTVGMQDMVGPSVYSSVFGNQQTLDVGSPLSPSHKHMPGHMSGPLGLPLFSTFPTQASYDIITAPQEPQEAPLLGRLSGLSLEAIMASPMSARTPSASALYFLQGAQHLRTSRPEGITLQSQPQVLLSPFHNQDRHTHSTNGASASPPPASVPPPAAHAAPGTNTAGATAPAPGGISDDLGLVMKPLHVKTRKGTGSEQGAGPSGLTNKAPSMYLSSMGAPLSLGTPSMHQVLLQDGTPTTRMLCEVFSNWGAEPNTPSHVLLGNSPHHTVVMPGPLLSGPQLHINGPQDSLFGPTCSFVRLQPELAGNDGPVLPEISVPAPEEMGCLEIMFDDPGPALPTPTVFQGMHHGPPARAPTLMHGLLPAHGMMHGSNGGAPGALVKQEPLSPQPALHISMGGRGPVGAMSPPQPGRPSPGAQTLHGHVDPVFMTPAMKRTSGQVWGDSYSPGHSASKRKIPLPSMPGLGHAADPTGMQHSTESSGTPLPLMHTTSVDHGLVNQNSLLWTPTLQKRSGIPNALSLGFDMHLSYDNGAGASHAPHSNGGAGAGESLGADRMGGEPLAPKQ